MTADQNRMQVAKLLQDFQPCSARSEKPAACGLSLHEMYVEKLVGTTHLAHAVSHTKAVCFSQLFCFDYKSLPVQMRT